MFTCNHCPFVKAYEDRLIKIQEDYSDRSVSLIAINSNETINYPEDTFEKMQIRVTEKSYNFTYLRDEDQSVASSYGASVTPEIFVFDSDRNYDTMAVLTIIKIPILLILQIYVLL